MTVRPFRTGLPDFYIQHRNPEIKPTLGGSNVSLLCKSSGNIFTVFCNVFKNIFLSEKKDINELKEGIEKTKKAIKDRDQLICALADQSQDEVK